MYKSGNYANKDMIVLHIGIILITRQLVYQSRESLCCWISIKAEMSKQISYKHVKRTISVSIRLFKKQKNLFPKLLLSM